MDCPTPRTRPPAAPTEVSLARGPLLPCRMTDRCRTGAAAIERHVGPCVAPYLAARSPPSLGPTSGRSHACVPPFCHHVPLPQRARGRLPQSRPAPSTPAPHTTYRTLTAWTTKSCSER
jgi:hypothetical protein